jgi:hypothetical protein
LKNLKNHGSFEYSTENNQAITNYHKRKKNIASNDVIVITQTRLVNKQSDIQGDNEASMPQNLFTCETFTCKMITNANGMCVLLGAFVWCLIIPHFQL